MHIQFVFVNIVLLYFPFVPHTYGRASNPSLRFSHNATHFQTRSIWPHRQNRPISCFIWFSWRSHFHFICRSSTPLQRMTLSHHPNPILSFLRTHLNQPVYHSFAFTPSLSLTLCDVRTDVQCTFSQNTKNILRYHNASNCCITIASSLIELMMHVIAADTQIHAHTFQPLGVNRTNHLNAISSSNAVWEKKIIYFHLVALFGPPFRSTFDCWREMFSQQKSKAI